MKAAQDAFSGDGFVVLNEGHRPADGRFKSALDATSLKNGRGHRLNCRERNMTGPLMAPLLDFEWMRHGAHQFGPNTLMRAMKLEIVVSKLSTGPMSANASWASCGSGST